MFISFSSFLKKSMFLYVLMFALVGCGGSSSSNGGGSETPVELQDAQGMLSTIGITTVKQLKEKVESIGALALAVEIQNSNKDMTSQKVVTTLKENNRNIEYKKLAVAGVDSTVLEKLKKLNESPIAVENMIQLPDPEVFPIDWASAGAISKLNEIKLKKVNRKLKLNSQHPISMAEFIALQSAFVDVDMINNFGKLDKPFQNVLVRDPDGLKVSKNSLSKMNKMSKMSRVVPVGYSVLNEEVEPGYAGDPGDFPFSNDNSCLIMSLDLPLAIAWPINEIEHSLVTNINGDVAIKIPQVGIAEFLIYSQANNSLVLKNNAGDILINEAITEGYHTVYLPVTNADKCKSFTFEGASENFYVTLVGMINPQRISDVALVDGKTYITSGADAELINTNSYFNSQSYSFSSFNSAATTIDFLFQVDMNISDGEIFDYLLYSPNGTVLSGTINGSNGFNALNDISFTSGIWRLDLLPPNSVVISENKVQELTVQSVRTNNEDGDLLKVTTLINNNEQIQTKEFVLGVLKNVSLKTQGDDGVSNEGEVTLDLNTNAAPKLNIPSYIDEIISRGDHENDDVALWKCWTDSVKSGHEFDDGADCYIYKAEYLRRKDLYELLHTYDYQNDPQYYRCRDEDGDEDVCIRGELGPYNINNPSDSFKVITVMNDFSKNMQREYQDVDYLNVLTNYYDLYSTWQNRIIQVDNGQFPYDGFSYKTLESKYVLCESGEIGCEGTALGGDGYKNVNIPVIMEVNRPIFGVPVSRLNESTQPITFDYIASDMDDYDVNAANFAYLNYFASQTYNIFTANFVGMVCDTVDLTDDLHDVELAAEDDPLGSAKATINRYSVGDSFYGLNNQDNFSFYMSGYPEENTDIDTYGDQINYVQMACGAVSIAASGYKFAKNANLIVNLDYDKLGDTADVIKILGGTAAVATAANLATEAEEIAQLISEGKIDEAKERLKVSEDVSGLTSGRDIYDDLDSLIANGKPVGSAGNGNNVLKSSANYLLGTGKKTRAGVEFERVSSVPVSNLSVSLDQVEIISNYENGLAQISLIPFVGVISDSPRQGDELFTLFSDIDDSGDDPWNYLKFGYVDDGDVLDTANTILYQTSDSTNMAAVYVELLVREEDGIGVEDDDMIGVFSKTIKLEEIFNSDAEFKWTYLGGNNYKLVIDGYPIYNSANQLSLENPLDDNYEKQKTHNQNRVPSALVSLTVNLTMGDITEAVPKVDTSIETGILASGKDTYSMEMSVVNDLEIDYSSPEIFDILDGTAVISEYNSRQVYGSFYSYDVATFAMQKLFEYDINDFSGELLPIKESLISPKSTGLYHRTNDGTNKELSLVKLLPNNRMLFVISHHDGAKLIIASYDNAGVITVERSVSIKDESENQVYTLLRATLSPDRTHLMVPFIPASYAGSDKTIAPEPKINLYKIDGDTVSYLSTTIVNFASVHNVEFVDNSHAAVVTHNLAYVTESDTYPYFESIQENCTSGNLNCLFELIDSNILVYSIDESFNLNLTDTTNIFNPPMYGYGIRYIGPGLFGRSDLQMKLVSAIPDDIATFRIDRAIHQFYFESDNLFFSSSEHSRRTSSKLEQLKYNPQGEYYCAGGVSCSGHLKSALRPQFVDSGVYTSEQQIFGFEFADTARDLLLGFNAERNLVLLSLYNGAAFKGPQIIGDIFDTEVLMSGANDTPGFGFTFAVTDRDTRIDQLTVSINPVTAVTMKEAHHEGDHVYEVSCITDSSGDGTCSGTIVPNFYNGSLKQDIEIIIGDGIYTTKRKFTAFIDREPPVLNDITEFITVASPTTYSEFTYSLDSSTSSLSNPCGGDSYCHLRQNGYVDSWLVANQPAWLTYDVITAAYGNKTLSFHGTPPMNAAGTYVVNITAIQNPGESTKVEESMVLTLNVIPPDTTPDPFSFTSQGDIELSTLVESSTISVRGINGYASLVVVGGEFWRSSTSLWSSVPASNIVNGEIIKLRQLSSSEYDTTSIASVAIGGVIGTFNVATKVDPNANDTTPDAFAFTAVTGQFKDQVITSNTITITGINEPSDLTIVGGEYRIGAGEWLSSPTTITNNQTVAVRHTSSDSYLTETTTTLIIGGVSGDFVSTTLAISEPELSAGGGITSPTINTVFSFTPDSSAGGEVASWSVENKPSWATFNAATGELSGTVNSEDTFTIQITATNAAGSDTFTTTVNVDLLSAPYINGYSVSCTIDDNTCDIEFTDNSTWRAVVDSVSISSRYGDGSDAVTLSSPSDYELTEGHLLLKINSTNQMVKTSGDWLIKLEATGYYDSNVDLMLGAGAITITDVVVNPAFAAGQVSTVTMNAKNRFGMAVSNADVIPTIVTTNNDSALTEEYKYSGGGSGFIWKSFAGGSLYADGAGVLSFEVKLPGCIDQHDGFTLDIGANSIIYTNSAGTCLDTDWVVRNKPAFSGASNVVVDSSGNVYSVISSYEDFDEFTHQGSGAGQDLYLIKHDRNGRQLWIREIASARADWVEALKIYNDEVYIAGTTGGDIGGDGAANSQGYALFVMRYNSSGTRVWSRQIGGETTTDVALDMEIVDDTIHLLGYMDLNASMNGTSELYTLDLNGDNQQTVIASSVFSSKLGTKRSSDMVIDGAGNYIFSMAGRIVKFDSSGGNYAVNSDIPYDYNHMDMVISGSSVYVSMNTDEVMADEVLNSGGYDGVRVISMDASSLSINWGKLIQTTDQYSTNSSNGRLVEYNGVLYVTVQTEGELYYDDSLPETPNATINLIALHAGDGSELSYKNWIAEPRSDAITQVNDLFVTSSGLLYLAGNVNHTFESTAQIGYTSSGSTTYFPVNSVIIKTKLSATPGVLNPTGMVRNHYANIVNDYDNDIQWDDRSNTIWQDSNWEGADSECVELNNTLHTTGWRLPTEAEASVDDHVPGQNIEFENFFDPEVEPYYWISAENEDFEDDHFAIKFSGLGKVPQDKYDMLYYRCVRDMD